MKERDGAGREASPEIDAARPSTDAAAVLAKHEALLGETFDEAAQGLARDGIDARSVARDVKRRAADLACRLDAAEASRPASWSRADDGVDSGSTRGAGWIKARVSGSSMEADGIRDGDTLFADPDRQPMDGDMVLADMAGVGRVVGRLRMEGAKPVRLEPAHRASPP